jgi:N-acetyl sugar amidotransferase
MTIKICKFCTTPSSRPRISFDKDGICNACNNAKQKKKIDWSARETEFQSICDDIKNTAKKLNSQYDCVVPWSGGKDSTSIALKLKFEFGLKPLLVTNSPLIPNQVGEQNREILLNKGFDNIFVRPNQKVAKYLAKRFFTERGNPKVAWDAGVNVVPVKIAVKFKIPYIFYAEHGESEYGGLVLNDQSAKVRDYEEVIEHQIGDYPENWIDDKVDINDLNFYIYPDVSELEKLNLKAFYFSYFFRWSMADNYDYVKKHLDNFKINESGRTTGTFTNFDSLDDKIDDLYYYMQFIKFGFGRAVRDTSRFIQNDRMSRHEALEIIKKYDGEFASKNLGEVLGYLDLKEDEFQKIVDKHRNTEIWKKNEKNDWLSSWELKNKIF